MEPIKPVSLASVVNNNETQETSQANVQEQNQNQSTSTNATEQQQENVLNEANNAAQVNSEVAQKNNNTDTAQNNAQPVQQQQAEQTQDDVVEFEQPVFESAQQQPKEVQQTEAVTTWRDALKNETERSEILKELNLDPFVLELNEHIKRGGSAADYIAAKAVDWDKVSDLDILKADFEKEYPDATPAQIQRLINKKYSQTDIADEEDKEDGLLLLQRDARVLRGQKKTQQSSFKLPEPIQQQAQQTQSNPEQDKVIQERGNFFKKIQDSEAHKNFLESKKVAIQLGEGVKPINVSIKNPSELYDILFNPQLDLKSFLTPQGEPDMQKIYEFGLFKSNPEQFKKLVRGNAIEKATQQLVEEGQNAVRPGTVIPITSEQYSNVGEAFGKGQISRVKLGSFDR